MYTGLVQLWLSNAVTADDVGTLASTLLPARQHDKRDKTPLTSNCLDIATLALLDFCPFCRVVLCL